MDDEENVIIKNEHVEKNTNEECQDDEKKELADEKEFTDEKVDILIYCEGFSSRKPCCKNDLNRKIKDLFESCNINFLIGSGYCYEKLKTLGDLESLIEKNAVVNKNNINNKIVVEALILYDFFRNSIYPHVQDLESKCSYENSNKFIINLASLLSNRNDKNLLKRINLFTTNYDMYFELSLEKNSIFYNDGFSGRLTPEFSTDNYNRIVKQIVQNTERESQIPTINLFKLHGSLAWKKDSEQIRYRSNLIEVLKNIEDSAEVFNDKRFMYDKLSNPNIQETIENIDKNRISFEDELLKKVNNFLENYKKLHIINPTKKKFEETLLSNIYYDLLRMYSNELEKNNSVIFVFGFSFKDEHIYSITKRALANPSMIMYIFVHSEKNIDDFKKIFKDHNNVFYVYCHDKNINLCEFTSLMFGDNYE